MSAPHSTLECPWGSHAASPCYPCPFHPLVCLFQNVLRMNPTRVWLLHSAKCMKVCPCTEWVNCHSSLSPTCLPLLAEGPLGWLLFQFSAITSTAGTFHAGSVCRCFQISWVNLCEHFGIVCDAVGFCQKSPSCPPKWPPRPPPSHQLHILRALGVAGSGLWPVQ